MRRREADLESCRVQLKRTFPATIWRVALDEVRYLAKFIEVDKELARNFAEVA